MTVLEDRDQRAADREAGAVEAVEQPRLAAVGGTVAEVRPARLEVAAERAGGDLPVRLLSREPDLEVVGLGGGEAEIAGRERHHAVRQAEQVEDPAGVAGHLLELREAGFGGF